MTIGLVLLSANNYYLDAAGMLPKDRPSWDKQFLLDMCKGQVVVCSSNTMIDLPPSIFKVAKTITTDLTIEYDINLGIEGMDAVDLLIVTRCESEIFKGRQFRLNKYKRILKQGDIEIWKNLDKQP